MVSTKFTRILFVGVLISITGIWSSAIKNSGLQKTDTASSHLQKNLLDAVGQSIYLKSEGLKEIKNGSANFIKDISKSPFDKQNQYIIVPGPQFRFHALNDHHYKIVDAFEMPHPIFGHSTFLKLKRIDNGESFFFRFNPKKDNEDAPFILSSTIENRKKVYLGHQYILRHNPEHPKGKFTDINNGKAISGNLDEIWTCADVLVDVRRAAPALLLVNTLNRMILVSSELADDPKYMLETVQVERFVERHGKEKWRLVSKGHIKLGMTRKMIHMSLGNPKKINSVYRFDQWIYHNRYLYFKDGILFKIR